MGLFGRDLAKTTSEEVDINLRYTHYYYCKTNDTNDVGYIIVMVQKVEILQRK